MQDKLKSIVIVGGGTAGWITAGLLAASIKQKYAENTISIVLVESKNISPIGVGEGTWPTMRNTLAKMGISEKLFLQECNASFKQGSKFVDWCYDPKGHSYYHPFSLPIGFQHVNLAQQWMLESHEMSFAEYASSQQVICEHYLAPKNSQSPDYSGICNYGYHLDAGLFSNFLRKHCVNHLGVKHIIDCSGQKALLIGQHYKIPLVSKKNQLFIDSAIAAQVSYSESNSPIQSATLSTAKDSGWIWDIGLQNRRGVGYAYASEYIDDDKAAKTLQNYIFENNPSINEIDLRKITFEPGYRAKFWKNNCVAIGLSAGFVEPLEASSIAMVELSANMIAEQLPLSLHGMQFMERQFNETFLYRWERIIDFLKLHYVLSDREDSDFWRDNKKQSSISETLQSLLHKWQYIAPWHYDFDKEEVFPAASYQYILCGMGFKTETNTPFNAEFKERLVGLLNNNQKHTQQCLSQLPSNREFFNNL